MIKPTDVEFFVWIIVIVYWLLPIFTIEKNH